MKNYYSILIIFCFGITAKAQTISIPDANFKTMLVSAGTNNLIAADASGTFIKIDTNNDGEIQVEEAALVKTLQFSGFNFQDQPNIALSVSGLEYFDNVETLVFDDKYIPLLDVSGMASLKYINTGSYMKIDTLNASGSTSILGINSDNSQVTNIDVSNATSLLALSCQRSKVMSLNVNGATNLRTLNCRGNTLLPSLNLTNLPSLETLICSGLYYVTQFDLSALTNLKTIECQTMRGLTALDFSGLANLEKIDCSDTSHSNTPDGLINSINIAGAVNLKSFDCENNNMTSLDFSGYTNLEYLSCGDNNITSINLAGAVNLKQLYCRENDLTTIDLSDLVNLERLDISYNKITTLDASQSSHFLSIGCYGNPFLESLFIKNGGNEGENNNTFHFSSVPNLHYICADESELANIQYWVGLYNMVNCEINSYCSFVPGGTSYLIAGNNRFDTDANGCDANDGNFPYMKYSITDGTDTGTLIANPSGSYTLSVKAGTHTMTPVLENPDYFMVSPTSATITFPAETDPFTQNFCVSANGIHNDAEVNIIPITQARPGFDVTYRMIYKNKGNQTLAGTLSFAYNASVLHFVSASVVPSSQPMNYINWDFTNLKPFENKEVFITLHLNSPVDVPPVNGGFILNYTLNINTGATDETPADNIFVLTQTVVNSFDPNEKVCLEGNTITPERIGKYVHYVIHFENTGTANAENIVIKDVIDIAKFDISSLVPIAGSHPFSTKISQTNKVEFIFENINLPFDDANNDGYVAFKIKTLPTLAVGDSFSNSANIYFDYNAPINTEPAVTAIHSLLANTDFEFSRYFTLSPNPAKNVLQIDSKNNLHIASISIYNSLGQLVNTISNPGKTIDVSNLKTGSYILKVVSNQGTANSKFIKA